MQHLLTQTPKKKQQAAANVVYQRAVFQLVDNRSHYLHPANLFQNTSKNSVVQRQVIQFGKTKYGDSAKLARERFKLGGGKRSKGINFKKWKRGREAQHLIPAQVCRDYGIPKSWANSAGNGMMLPSGRRNTNHLRIKKLDKGKMHHIKGGGSHPNYNKYAFKLAKQNKWKRGKVSRAQFDKLTNTLRKKNRPKRKGAASGYIDDLK